MENGHCDQGSGAPVCTCDEGFFLSGAVCQAWTNCPAGTLVDIPGSSTADRACAGCEPGTFAAGDNAPVCEPWTACSAVEVAGSSKADQVCVQDCVVDWSMWTCCRPTLTGLKHGRTGQIVTQPSEHGAACPELAQTESCGAAGETICCDTSSQSVCALSAACTWVEASTTCVPTPVDCMYANWSSWTECSMPCEGGKQTRSRAVASEPVNGGAACTQPLLEERTCNDGVNCVCTEYSTEPVCVSVPACVWSMNACATPASQTPCDQIVDEPTCVTSTQHCIWFVDVCVASG